MIIFPAIDLKDGVCVRLKKGVMEDATVFNTDPADILTLEQRTNALTLDDIKQAANRYLNTENYVQAVLYPEQTVAAKK